MKHKIFYSFFRKNLIIMKMRNIKESLVKILFFLTAVSSIIIVFFIFAFLIKEGSPAFMDVGILEFVTGMKWHAPADIYGILPLIVVSLLITFGAMVFAVGLGVPTAIFLSEVAPNRVKIILKPAVEMLAGVPSIVYGFIGMVLLVGYLGPTFDMLTGRSILAGSILLGIMALPTVVSVSEDAISVVPTEFKEGSLALGATKWQTIKTVTFPAAFSGIAAAVILGMGRAIGETMAVLLVVGNICKIPIPFFDYFETGQPLTAKIAGEMGEAGRGSLQYHALFGVGVTLLIIVFILNLIAEVVMTRLKKKWGGV
ncbi:MAG: phosphate ABC transporter permease subunit PstC [Thermoplasmatales archaeon]|nr:phosphate ABC transporter permease subunit PstC [Thermoplasmatales archaeon]